jgi:hypothetical protein
VDDVSWVRGNHTFGFGGNVRLITNNRNSLGASFDEAIINPSFYNFSGDVLIDPFSDFVSSSDLRDALASVIGRYSQYSANLVYDASGQLQQVGTPTDRAFATQEYEAYFQDSWRMRPNFTFNYGRAECEPDRLLQSTKTQRGSGCAVYRSDQFHSGRPGQQRTRLLQTGLEQLCALDFVCLVT